MLPPRTPPASSSASSAASTAMTPRWSARPRRPTTDGCAAGTPRRSRTAPYVLASEAFGAGGSAFSSGVSITVSNPPTTSVLLPSNGATLVGSTTLDASASNATSVEFRLFGGIYGYAAPVLCTATLTYYGWLCSWNTTTVPSGSYFLVSEAFNSAGSAFSSGVSVTVHNPASLADLTGSFSGTTSYTGWDRGCAYVEQVFDATYPGSSAVGSVTLHLDGCVFDIGAPTYAGTFTIATSVGTLAGNAAGPNNSDHPPFPTSSS